MTTSAGSSESPPDPVWTRYERRLRDVRGPDAAHAHMVAEASREARVTSDAADPIERALVEVTAGVAAPFLVSYVGWVLRRAEEQGVDRLYFLARDGQILHRLATMIDSSAPVRSELRYLMASRVTLNLAAASELTDETIPWLLTGLRRQSVVSLCERLHLEPNELATTLERLGITADEWESPFGGPGAAEMQQALLEPGNVQLIQRRAGDLRTRTEPYLRSMGFLDAGTVGVVDLGGTGSQLHALGRFREQAGLVRPVGYLVYRDLSPLKQQDREGRIAGCSELNTYLTEGATNQGGPRVTGFVPLLETFCAADHGRVVDYERGPASVDAVTEEHFAVAVHRWGLPLVRETMITMVAQLLRTSPSDVHADRLLPVLTANLHAFIRKPTTSEAEAWGSFPEHTSEDGGASALGPVVTLGDVAQRLWTRRSIGGLSRWWPGSLARSPRYLRLALGLARAIRRFPRGALGRAPRRWRTST